MPKELNEIKGFNSGTILNASERDIPHDTAAFSLNVDSTAEEGVLSSINTDRHVFTSGPSTYFEDSIPWGVSSSTSTWHSELNHNKHRNVLNEISVLGDKGIVELFVKGIKGVREKLIASHIEPIFRTRGIGDSLQTDSIEKITPSATVDI